MRTAALYDQVAMNNELRQGVVLCKREQWEEMIVTNIRGLSYPGYPSRQIYSKGS